MSKIIMGWISQIKSNEIVIIITIINLILLTTEDIMIIMIIIETMSIITIYIIIGNQTEKSLTNVIIYIIPSIIGTILIMQSTENEIIGIIGFIIKIGLIPFQEWVLIIIQEISQIGIYIINYIPKMIIIYKLTEYRSIQIEEYINEIIIINLLIGIILTIKKNSIRQIYQISSIINIYWMIMIKYWEYLIIYNIISLIFIYYIKETKYNIIMIILLIGLPPMIIFKYKLYILTEVINKVYNEIIIIMTLLVGIIMMIMIEKETKNQIEREVKYKYINQILW